MTTCLRDGCTLFRGHEPQPHRSVNGFEWSSFDVTKHPEWSPRALRDPWEHYPEGQPLPSEGFEPPEPYLI